MRNATILGGLSVFLFTVFMQSAAAEDEFRYNYAQVAYASLNADEPGYSNKMKVSQTAVTGSYALLDMLAVQATAGFVNDSFSDTGISLDGKGTTVGLGVALHTNVSDSVEVGLDLGRSREDIKYTINGTAQPTEKGYTNDATARVRAVVIPKLLLEATAGRSLSNGNVSSSTSYSAGVEYDVAENVSVGGSYMLGHSTSTGRSNGYWHGLTVGARFYF